MSKTTHSYCTFKLRVFLRIFVLYLMFAILPRMLASQTPIYEHGDFCPHHCSHLKTLPRTIGIYDQDLRVHDYDIKFYGIHLDVEPSSVFIVGSTRIIAEILKPDVLEIVVELVNELLVNEVLINGEPVAFVKGDNIVEIKTQGPLIQGEVVDLVINYSGEPTPSGFFSGIQSTSNGLGQPVLWTLSEPHNARQWFPVKQVLADKADSAQVSITVPEGYMAASNGLLVNITQQPGNRQRFEWKTRYPIAYYLLSMAVAAYQDYSYYVKLPGRSDSLLVQNFIYNHPQTLLQNRDMIKKTDPMLQLYSQLWGNYPYADEKYGHAMAPMSGAMEHQTMSTMGYFGFDIIAHELAHHWFGNNVTCASWNDIWINEGFASYAEYMAREFLEGPASAATWMAGAHNNIKGLPGGSVYVPQMELANVNRIFNGRLSYRKGAAIIHQLRFELNNDALFFSIMEQFQQRYANGVATGDDFKTEVSLHTGKPWDWFFDQWYYGEGYPRYAISWWQTGNKLFIRSSQTASAAIPNFFAGTLEFEIATSNRKQLIRFFQDQPLQTFELDVSEKVTDLVFDPGNFMLKNFSMNDSTDAFNPGKAEVKFYPNPFAGYINYEISDLWHGCELSIFDLTGRLLFKTQIAQFQGNILLPFRDAGLVLIEVTSKNGAKRVIKGISIDK